MTLVPRIRLYTTQWCGYCIRAKALLGTLGLAYDEVELDDDPASANASSTSGSNGRCRS